MQQSYTSLAREYFDQLGNGGNSPDALKNMIQEYLQKDGKGLEALDPTGNSSREEMDAKLEEKWKAEHVLRARKYFKVLENGDALFPSLAEKAVKESLRKAGVDESVLDDMSERSQEDMAGVLKERVEAAMRTKYNIQQRTKEELAR